MLKLHVAFRILPAHAVVRSVVVLCAVMLGTGAQAANCDYARNSLDAVHCKNLVYQKADKQLNRSYQRLMHKLAAADKKILRTAQLSWIKTRDRACTLTSVDMGEVIDSTCMLDQTTARTNWLNDRLRECNTVGCLRTTRAN